CRVDVFGGIEFDLGQLNGNKFTLHKGANVYCAGAVDTRLLGPLVDGCIGDVDEANFYGEVKARWLLDKKMIHSCKFHGEGIIDFDGVENLNIDTKKLLENSNKGITVRNLSVGGDYVVNIANDELKKPLILENSKINAEVNQQENVEYKAVGCSLHFSKTYMKASYCRLGEIITLEGCTVTKDLPEEAYLVCNVSATLKNCIFVDCGEISFGSSLMAVGCNFSSGDENRKMLKIKSATFNACNIVSYDMTIKNYPSNLKIISCNLRNTKVLSEAISGNCNSVIIDNLFDGSEVQIAAAARVPGRAIVRDNIGFGKASGFHCIFSCFTFEPVASSYRGGWEKLVEKMKASYLFILPDFINYEPSEHTVGENYLWWQDGHGEAFKEAYAGCLKVTQISTEGEDRYLVEFHDYGGQEPFPYVSTT
ncbi:MAG: hypothetical protein HUK20_01305, partial [Fibrobacter sp.]|nr:hypothetical protein [Fibrobacter sp.]